MGTQGMLRLVLLRTRPLMAGVLVAGLAACSGAESGVEMNGKLFDVVGMNSIGKKAPEPKLAERAPLVPPPNTGALPAPGAAEAPPEHMAWPDDPDRRKSSVAASADTEKLRKYCADPMLGRPDVERAKRDAECMEKQGGMLATASSWLNLNKKKEGASAETTDEGDPAVKTGSTKPAAPLPR